VERERVPVCLEESGLCCVPALGIKLFLSVDVLLWPLGFNEDHLLICGHLKSLRGGVCVFSSNAPAWVLLLVSGQKLTTEQLMQNI